MWEILLFIAGYLMGCVNASILLTRLLEKQDVRNFGSGNAGFTNTLRNFKKTTAVLVFIGDALKAALILTVALWVAPGNSNVLFCAALGVILGHNFPVFYRFRGGKGILVSIVAIFFVDWRIGLVLLAVSLVIMFKTGYVSLGSVIGAVMLPVLMLFFHGGWHLVFALVISSLSIFMHRENIKRLLAGTENRFGKRRENENG